jgi:hypothetical protein
MAGTIVANTINTDTGLFTTNNAYLGIAKAWVNFLGASGTVNGSFNVSSVTRNSAGNYTINFTTAMANTYYTVSGAVSEESTGFGLLNIYAISGGAPATMTTSAVRVACLGYTNYYDPNTVTVVINGS